MAGTTHINQHGVRGETKVQNAHHKILESVLGGFIKQDIQESKELLRYCDSEARQELQTHQRGSVSVFFFWLMCIFKRTHLPE
ncbi:uncharacterized protein LOC115730442 isoform X2 [Rhodamnia argentea]|uniref:Uncharacterized protein LOC115730442 isoform X2 n=1 Tax=Rhodamnia argentea TaxID=178133 RepID=A0ABM3HFJ6_9MYRT|nr:uncharacterized protein LOC115730442 isoform X2 [Rhodamnia argentea]